MNGGGAVNCSRDEDTLGNKKKKNGFTEELRQTLLNVIVSFLFYVRFEKGKLGRVICYCVINGDDESFIGKYLEKNSLR